MKAKVNGKHEFVIDKKGRITTVNGSEMEFDLKDIGPGTYHLLMNNKSYNIEVVESNKISKKHQLRINGKMFNVELHDRYDELLHELGMDNAAGQKIGDLKAPMPGLVVDIPVSEGQAVKKGETLLILEAMKMENALKATADVTIGRIAVKKGMAVEKNEMLIQLS